MGGLTEFGRLCWFAVLLIVKIVHLVIAFFLWNWTSKGGFNKFILLCWFAALLNVEDRLPCWLIFVSSWNGTSMGTWPNLACFVRCAADLKNSLTYDFIIFLAWNGTSMGSLTEFSLLCWFAVLLIVEIVRVLISFFFCRGMGHPPEVSTNLSCFASLLRWWLSK